MQLCCYTEWLIILLPSLFLTASSTTSLDLLIFSIVLGDNFYTGTLYDCNLMLMMHLKCCFLQSYAHKVFTGQTFSIQFNDFMSIVLSIQLTMWIKILCMHHVHSAHNCLTICQSMRCQYVPVMLRTVAPVVPLGLSKENKYNAHSISIHALIVQINRKSSALRILQLLSSERTTPFLLKTTTKSSRLHAAGKSPSSLAFRTLTVQSPSSSTGDPEMVFPPVKIFTKTRILFKATILTTAER